MLNDAVCFKAVYIVCGYTDLRSGMDRLAALVEAQTGNRPYVPDTLFKRILFIFVADDHGEAINPFAEIYRAARQHDTPDTGIILKHGRAPPL
ncbi:MAG: transposase [Treponema sp.]|nr:transposase [Treponema sp.]